MRVLSFILLWAYEHVCCIFSSIFGDHLSCHSFKPNNPGCKSWYIAHDFHVLPVEVLTQSVMLGLKFGPEGLIMSGLQICMVSEIE